MTDALDQCEARASGPHRCGRPATDRLVCSVLRYRLTLDPAGERRVRREGCVDLCRYHADLALFGGDAARVMP